MLPNIKAYQGQRGFYYGAYAIHLRLSDSFGKEQESVSTFYAVDLPGPPMLLSRPWRYKQAVIMNSATDEWRYGSATHAVHVRDPSDFFRDVRKEARVFLIRGSASSSGRGSAQIAEQLPAEFREFADVFTYEDIANLKRPEGVKHAIDLESGRKPPF